MKNSTGHHGLVLNALIIFIAVLVLPFNTTAQSKSVKTSIQINKLKIKIGSKTFMATLADNETAKAFEAMLPLTLKMDDINSNEKKFDFPKRFPGQLANPIKINTGDLMIWSGNTLVLFYKTFSTPYSYTKLGHIDDASGLAAALGTGNITVIYESADQ